MSRVKRLLLSGYVLVLAAGITTGVGASTPAQAAAGDVVITGHGYGHGRGLSQWGSYGYSTRFGWNHLQILSHYYSNASFGDIGNPLLTVRLTALDNTAIQVMSQAPFTAGGWYLNGGTVAQMSRNADGTWQLTTRNGCHGPITGTVQVGSSLLNIIDDPGDDLNKMLTVCDNGRTYRGALSLVVDGGNVRTVNTVYMQDYLRGVVPRESPASWGSAAGGAGLNALMAQAVAARAYAWAEDRAAYAKTCDTTTCQVYGGAGLWGSSLEDYRTDAAVHSTAGEVMMLGGQVARTEFSSSTGGYTAGGTFPAVPDDGDRVSSPYADWSVTFTSSQVSDAFGVGALRSVTVLSRNGLGVDGGRVTKVRVSGVSRTVDVTGNEFRSALGLKSDWFTPSGVSAPDPAPPQPRDISPTTISAVRTQVDSVITFVRGTNGSLFYTTSTYGAFGPFQELRAGAASGPAAGTTDGRRIEVFVEGTDKALWHTSTDVDAAGRATTWAPWESMGGGLTAAPAVASSAAGNMIVSVRATDGSVFSRVKTAGGWSGWVAAGGGAISAPSVEVVDASTYRLRVVGTDGVMWTRDISAATGEPTTPWASTGRATGFAPAVSATNWAHLGVRAVAGSNGPGIRQVWGDGQIVDIGGGVSSTVAMVEWATSSTWTFARGTDGALWINMLSDPSQPSTWYLIGGAIT